MSSAALRLPGLNFLRVLDERRSLLFQLVKRDFTQRFVGSAAGWLWTIVHPLVLLLSWVFVFQWCMKLPPPPGAGESYTLYLFCGYLPWLLFQETLQRSATSLVDQSTLITKTLFPSEIIPVSIFLSSLTSHAFALLAGILAVKWMTGHISILLALLPFYMLMTGLFAVGVAWIVSALQVYLRDTAQVVLVLLTGWFWFTPIFIDETNFPENMRFLVHWNPLAHIVKAYRQLMLGYQLPPLSEYIYLLLLCGGTFVVGGLFFRHLKRGFADVL